MRILGLDSGLRRFGYAVAEWDGQRLRFVAAGVWETAPGAAARKGEDTSSRARALYQHLRAACMLWPPDVLAVEALAFPSARVQWSVISGLGRARGLVDALAVEVGVPLFEVTPAEAKRAALGEARAASKQDVIAAIRGRHPELPRPRIDSLWEHVADAAAVVLATQDNWRR